MAEQIRFQRPQSLADRPTHYCPGCIHGIVHWLIAEVIDGLDFADRAIGIAPVGCSNRKYSRRNFCGPAAGP